MRAKLTVQTVTDNGFSDIVEFSADYNGTPEDNSFAEATPSANLSMHIDNPKLRGTIKPGETFYVEFSRANLKG